MSQTPSALHQAYDAIVTHQKAIHGPDHDYEEDESLQPEAKLYRVLPILVEALAAEARAPKTEHATAYTCSWQERIKEINAYARMFGALEGLRYQVEPHAQKAIDAILVDASIPGCCTVEAGMMWTPGPAADEKHENKDHSEP